MPSTPSRRAVALSAAVALAMAVQSAGGLFIGGLYRDNAWVRSAWLANDLITLIVAVPALAIALVLAARGSMRARLVWLGTLYYALYNNMYYLFGSAFNRFFLVYVALFILSASSLLLALTNIDIAGIADRFSFGRATRWAGGYMLLLAATLGVMWIAQCLVYVVGGPLPQIVVDTGGFTNLVAALDLTMIVPPLAIGAIWLLKSRPWGYVAGAALLVQCTITTAVLVVGGPVQAAAGIKGAWGLEPLWFAMGVGCAISAGLLLALLQPRRAARAA